MLTDQQIEALAEELTPQPSQAGGAFNEATRQIQMESWIWGGIRWMSLDAALVQRSRAVDDTAKLLRRHLPAPPKEDEHDPT